MSNTQPATKKTNFDNYARKSQRVSCKTLHWKLYFAAFREFVASFLLWFQILQNISHNQGEVIMKVHKQLHFHYSKVDTQLKVYDYEYSTFYSINYPKWMEGQELLSLGACSTQISLH